MFSTPKCQLLTTSLYAVLSPLLMRSVTGVSLKDLLMVLGGCTIISVQERARHIALEGVHAKRQGTGASSASLNTLGAVGQKIPDPGTIGGGWTDDNQLFNQDSRNDHIEHPTLIYEKPSDIVSWLLEVAAVCRAVAMVSSVNLFALYPNWWESKFCRGQAFMCCGIILSKHFMTADVKAIGL